MTMNRSWLVQRLNKPRTGSSLLGSDNPFAFGGGMRNGGLSDEAMGFLREIWSFDYMGAAEFEFGAVPKALQLVAKAANDGKLTTETIVIPVDEIATHWEDNRKGAAKRERPESGTVYLLCQEEHAGEAETRIRTWAAAEYNDLKEPTRLARSLDPVSKWDGDTQGWLELNNGFLFFTDRTMFEKTCELFGVEVNDKEAA